MKIVSVHRKLEKQKKREEKKWKRDKDSRRKMVSSFLFFWSSENERRQPVSSILNDNDKAVVRNSCANRLLIFSQLRFYLSYVYRHEKMFFNKRIPRRPTTANSSLTRDSTRKSLFLICNRRFSSSFTHLSWSDFDRFCCFLSISRFISCWSNVTKKKQKKNNQKRERERNIKIWWTVFVTHHLYAIRFKQTD